MKYFITGMTYGADNSKAKRELGDAPRRLRAGWVETLRHEINLLNPASK